jgi:phosphoribosylglycinamide formyltransferase-1
MTRLRVGVLISGRGSNLQALIDACADPSYPAQIALVISNHPTAQGLKLAASTGIRSRVIPYLDRQSFAAEAGSLLQEQRVELVCLAGFMRLLEGSFVESWRDRMVNIHPSLLPAFRGLHAQRQALAAGVRFSGCTVHFVRPEFDCGPIIGQAVVAVHPDDDEERLAARILEVEHLLYPVAVRLIAERRIKVIADKVEIDGCQVPQIAVLNPQAKPSTAFASTSS